MVKVQVGGSSSSEPATLAGLGRPLSPEVARSCAVLGSFWVYRASPGRLPARPSCELDPAIFPARWEFKGEIRPGGFRGVGPSDFWRFWGLAQWSPGQPEATAGWTPLGHKAAPAAGPGSSSSWAQPPHGLPRRPGAAAQPNLKPEGLAGRRRLWVASRSQRHLGGLAWSTLHAVG